MEHYMRSTILLTTTLLLSACVAQSNPSLTLDRKLSQATTQAERKETLRLACLNEAEWPASLKKIRNTGRYAMQQRQKFKRSAEIMEMKSLCRQMDDLTTADAEEKLLPKELAAACAAKVAEKTQKEVKGWVDHASRISQICERMIGSSL
jgi:hypothetical protein